MQDLARLLYLYQLWGHKMFPKLQFKEMIDRVEKLCHKESIMVNLIILLFEIFISRLLRELVKAIAMPKRN
jgi:hypothetical protein